MRSCCAPCSFSRERSILSQGRAGFLSMFDAAPAWSHTPLPYLFLRVSTYSRSIESHPCGSCRQIRESERAGGAGVPSTASQQAAQEAQLERFYLHVCRPVGMSSRSRCIGCWDLVHLEHAIESKLVGASRAGDGRKIYTVEPPD